LQANYGRVTPYRLVKLDRRRVLRPDAYAAADEISLSDRAASTPTAKASRCGRSE